MFADELLIATGVLAVILADRPFAMRSFLSLFLRR